MDWGMIVDTDSLYREMQERFFSQERVDYLQLPKFLLETIGIDAFTFQKALVLRRKGTMWKFFAESLERFGYEVVLTDRGVQNMTLALEISSLMPSVTGILLVTASKRIGPIIETLKSKQLRVAAFDNMDDLPVEQFVQLDRRCLWTGEQALKTK